MAQRQLKKSQDRAHDLMNAREKAHRSAHSFFHSSLPIFLLYSFVVFYRDKGPLNFYQLILWSLCVRLYVCVCVFRGLVDASIDAYPKADISSGAGSKGEVSATQSSSSGTLLGGLGLMGSSSSAAAPVRKPSVVDRDASEDQKVSFCVMMYWITPISFDFIFYATFRPSPPFHLPLLLHLLRYGSQQHVSQSQQQQPAQLPLVRLPVPLQQHQLQAAGSLRGSLVSMQYSDFIVSSSIILKY